MTKLKAVKVDPSSPHSALRRKARQMPASYREPRYLTEAQLKNPLFRKAFERLGNIASLRGQYLRELDRVNGDRRSRIEKFQALERVQEQFLVRLDLPTSTLGFIDEANGRFVLNTQRHIADDSKGVSEAVLSRLLGWLDAAGYVRRRIEKIRLDERDANGLHLVRTRVLIQFTIKFWADLGLRYVFERVQRSAMKRRLSQLRDIAQRRQSLLERKSLEEHRREVSRSRWKAKEERERKNEEPGCATAALTQAQVDTGQIRRGTRESDGVQNAMERLQRSLINKRNTG